MESDTPFTRYASAQRASPEEVHAQEEVFASLAVLEDFLNAAPYPALVLNPERQIVFANRVAYDLFGAADSDAIAGRRPGEALHCIHAAENEGGCGTSQFCQECGAVNAILSAQNGIRDARECRITRRAGDAEEALDLLVTAVPVVVEGRPFVACTLADISHEKRRRALERIFFHDILNAADSIQGLAEILSTVAESDDRERCVRLLSSSARQLLAEIRSQQMLLSAESRDLGVSPAAIDTDAIIERLAAQHPGAVRIDPASERIEMVSDPALLSRVLANMLKNAVEASKAGEPVTVSCRAAGDGVEFRVHNVAVMPLAVQRQVFQRSFSTKGIGRGLGTYSMKLLSERYLGGTVWFQSAEGEGTTFFVRYPRLLTV